LSRNLGTLTYWNPLGHSGPVMGLIYLYLYLYLYPKKSINKAKLRKVLKFANNVSNLNKERGFK